MKFVKRMKLNSLMESPEVDESTINAVFDELNQITDEEYCVSLCIEASVKELALVHRLLEHAQNRVRNSRGTIPHEVPCRLQGIIKRLGTFQLLYTRPFYQTSSWLDFRVADLPKHVSDLLLCEQMEEAVIIWRRHFEDGAFLSKLEMILTSVPRNTSFPLIYAFVRNDVIPRIRGERDM